MAPLLIIGGKGIIYQLPSPGNDCGFIKVTALDPVPVTRKYLVYLPEDKTGNLYTFKIGDKVEFDVEAMPLILPQGVSDKTFVAINLKKI